MLKYLLPYLKKYIISNPNKRDSHIKPKPSGGGIIFIISILIFLFIDLIILKSNLSIFSLISLICIPISIIGIFDDIFELKALNRYLIQILTVVFLILISKLFNFLYPLQDFSYINIIFLFLTITGATAIINFMNFMDGLDGLLGGVMIVIFSYFAIIKFPELWILVGSLIGFLMLNWSPSKVFMGDSGSTFLGAIYVGIVLQANDIQQSLEFILISTPLLADAFSCVIRRFAKNQNIFTAHKEHLYQRLNQAGWSHSNVSKLYLFATLVLVIVSYCGNLKLLISMALLEILVGIYLDKRIAVNFLSNKNTISKS
tara:strand:+ start:102 stop:1046 length:945 start_codon:yes stop_codon:yes gene_type:complete